MFYDSYNSIQLILREQKQIYFSVFDKQLKTFVKLKIQKNTSGFESLVCEGFKMQECVFSLMIKATCFCS